MRSIKNSFKNFLRNERGSLAVILGLSVFPVAGAAGIAIDYARMTNLRTALQSAADQTALQAVYADDAGRAFDVDAAFKAALGPAANNLLDSGQAAGGRRLAITGTWLERTARRREYKVVVAGTLGSTVLRALMPQDVLDVGVRTVALGTRTVRIAKIEGANIDPEAADYNETQAYCYDDKAKERRGPIDAKTGQRGPFAKVADNTDAGIKAGPLISEVRCDEGEEVSFLVKNIREARTSAAKQKSGTPRLFYTDTVRGSDDVMRYTVTFDGQTRNTLETVMCATRSQCQTTAKGGILFNEGTNRGRNPLVNTKVCKPGQFIYYGWEDRIPGVAGDNSDRDFDDIRMFLTCPSETQGPLRVRLTA